MTREHTSNLPLEEIVDRCLDDVAAGATLEDALAR
jgi:hypothetical protein